jgi:imidazolonepropionase-like amidohydrolase
VSERPAEHGHDRSSVCRIDLVIVLKRRSMTERIMGNCRAGVVTLVAVTSFFLSGVLPHGGPSLATAAEDEAAATVLIGDTTIIDGTGRAARHGVDLLIKAGRIEAIGERLQAPPGTRRLDGTGKFVIPGLIDAHVHLDFPVVFQLTPEERARIVDHTPQAFLYNGVTTVLNLSSDPEWIWSRREAQRDGRLVAPRIFAMGRAFTPEGGWGSRHGGALADAAAVRRQALEYVAANTDGFKVVIEDGLGRSGTYREIPDEMLDALADVARMEGVPLFVHAINLSEYRRAVEIEPRAIVHGLEDLMPPESDLIERLVSRGITVVPTVSLFESFLHPDPRAGPDLQDPVLEASVPGFLLEKMRRAEFMQAERQHFVEASARMDAYGWAASRVAVFRENVRKMHRAGVRIAVGTDAGGTVGYNFQGYNTPWEIKILVECGMSPMEALVAATRTGAEVIGIADRLGTIEPGKVADLLILSANPLDDIENIRRIEKVIQDGRVHERREFAYDEG